jgi:hypothetical protein
VLVIGPTIPSGPSLCRRWNATTCARVVGHLGFAAGRFAARRFATGGCLGLNPLERYSATSRMNLLIGNAGPAS